MWPLAVARVCRCRRLWSRQRSPDLHSGLFYKLEPTNLTHFFVAGLWCLISLSPGGNEGDDIFASSFFDNVCGFEQGGAGGGNVVY